MKEKINVLDLFSGIGGFSLGLERAGFKTVAFCEIEKYPRQILKQIWPDVPVYEDIKLLTKEKLLKDGIDDIGLICGGYPCQPFSVAGKQKGEADDRHLWPEMYRLIKTIRPRWVIAENVAGHINMGLDNVLSDLEAENYTCWSFVIPACAVNAIHRRDRVWIIGYTEHAGLTPTKERESIKERNDRSATRKEQASEFTRPSITDIVANTGDSGQQRTYTRTKEHDAALCSEISTNTMRERLQGHGGGRADEETIRQAQQPFVSTNSSEAWCNGFRYIEGPTESALCRADDGASNRSHRLKGLGNAVVPQIPELIGRAIMEIENEP